MFDMKMGDLVLLTLEPGNRNGITRGLREYEGRKFRISKVRTLKGQSMANRGTYYELKGCVSKEGIPYAISPMWIQPMREIKRK